MSETAERLSDEEVERRITLITDSLEEVVGDREVMGKIIAARPYRIYWGTAPTGEIHLGYLKPMLKIADFLDAGCDVTILFADIHAYLDSMKSSEKQLEARTLYYEIVIRAILSSLGVDLDRLHFVVGSSFQYDREYRRAEDRATAITSFHDANKAGAEVVKASGNPPMSSLRYPLLQALDEEFMPQADGSRGVDAQFGGSDQRKIFMLAQELLPKLKYRKRLHLMNPMVKALSKVKASENPDGGKMSASEKGGASIKIELMDTRGVVRKKIAATYALPGDADDNTVIELMRHIGFPILRRTGEALVISRKEEFGGDVVYKTVDELAADYASEKLHPADLKKGVVDLLNRQLDLIQGFVKRDERFFDVYRAAYGKKMPR